MALDLDLGTSTRSSDTSLSCYIRTHSSTLQPAVHILSVSLLPLPAFTKKIPPVTDQQFMLKSFGIAKHFTKIDYFLNMPHLNGFLVEHFCVGKHFGRVQNIPRIPVKIGIETQCTIKSTVHILHIASPPSQLLIERYRSIKCSSLLMLSLVWHVPIKWLLLKLKARINMEYMFSTLAGGWCSKIGHGTIEQGEASRNNSLMSCTFFVFHLENVTVKWDCAIKQAI